MTRTLIILGGCVLWGLSCNKPAPAVPADLTGFEVTQVSGSAFSKAVKMADSLKVESGYLLDGRRNGIWVHYTDDGKISKIEHYIDGKLNGPVIELDARGQIVALTEYTDNKYDGLKATYKFGRPQEEIEYVDGVIHGTMRKYYHTGKLMEEAEYKNNQQDGYYRHYSELGVLDLEYVYKNGEKVSGGIVTPPNETAE